jgi:hypothetical protein
MQHAPTGGSIMRTPATVRERLRVAKGRLHEYEGRLRKLEGQLKILRGQAEQARGHLRLRMLRGERQVRLALDVALRAVDEATRRLEPRLRLALQRGDAVRRGIEAGIKTGAAEYRRTRSR